MPPTNGSRISTALAGWESAADRFLAADSPRAMRIAMVVLIVAVSLAFVLVLVTGCSHQYAMPWDSVNLLNTAWRVHGGERPHADFFTHVGPVYWLVICLGFLFTGPTAHALAWGPVMVFPFLALAGWVLARPRLSALNALVFSLLAGFLLIGTYALGFPGRVTRPSYAMQYNRLGWSLLCLVSLAALLPPRTALSRRRETFEAVLAGVLLALVLFLKVNYFVGGLAVFVLGLILYPRKWAATLVAFAVVALALLAYVRFDAAAMLSDINSLREFFPLGGRLHGLAILIWTNIYKLAFLLLAWLFLLRPVLCAAGPTGGRSLGLRLFVGAAALAVVGLATCAGGAQWRQIPLIPLAGMLLMECPVRLRTSAGPCASATDLGARNILVGALTLVLAAEIVLPDAASVGNSFYWRRFCAAEAPASATLQTPALKDLLCPPLPGESADRETTAARIAEQPLIYTSYQWAVLTNDALALARDHVGPTDTIVMLRWYNPVPFALGLPSPRGYPSTLGEKGAPFDRLFADVTWVLAPKYPTAEEKDRLLQKTCRPAVERTFEKVAESRLWELWRRK